MKIAVMGSGGVGGFYGARLAKGGADVTFIARGAHLEAMRARGLRVESPLIGDFVLPEVKATDDPASIGPVDVVLITVKSYALTDAARAIVPLIGEHTVVIPLLNGVDIAERINEIVGAGHLMGGVVYVLAAIAEPGVIRHFNADRLVFGELDGGPSERGQAIEAVMKAAGVPGEFSTDIQKEIWNKFIFLSALAGITSVTRSPAGVVREDPDIRRLLIACMQESVALSRELGIAIEEEGWKKHLELIDSLPPQGKPSMLLDLEQGRKLEVEALNGTAARLGEKLGIPTPVNRFIYAVLKPHANGTP